MRYNSIMSNQREIWVDYVKVIACALVVFGHFSMSMEASGLAADTALYQWFKQTIYLFHVPLFFICSGYLYQKLSKVESLASWANNVSKKLLILGIPYLTFTTITWATKTMFSASVNNMMDYGLLETLFLHPTAPYWYLYALFLIFLITPTAKSRTALGTMFAVALAMKCAVVTVGFTNGVPYAIAAIFTNEIWFAIGVTLGFFKFLNQVQRHARPLAFASLGALILFLALSVLPFIISKASTGEIGKGAGFLLGILACLATIFLVSSLFARNQASPPLTFLAKYTLPIFLMHTLCAAPARIALLKLGIHDLAIHAIVGIVISFAAPIAIALIMERFKPLEFLLYPNKIHRISKTP
jgi:fucose 4-O-acetylase-like acetyltransferase